MAESHSQPIHRIIICCDGTANNSKHFRHRERRRPEIGFSTSDEYNDDGTTTVLDPSCATEENSSEYSRRERRRDSDDSDSLSSSTTDGSEPRLPEIEVSTSDDYYNGKTTSLLDYSSQTEKDSSEYSRWAPLLAEELLADTNGESLGLSIGKFRTPEGVEFLARCRQESNPEADRLASALTAAQRRCVQYNEDCGPRKVPDTDAGLGITSYQSPEELLMSRSALSESQLRQCVKMKKQDGKKTNVRKVYESIKEDQNTDKWYFPGPGTMPHDGFRMLSCNTNFIAQMFGFGVERRIRRAYEYLCMKYEGRRTEITLVGFSRGSLVAHGIASILSDVGIAKDHSTELFDMWCNMGRDCKSWFHGPLAEIGFPQHSHEYLCERIQRRFKSAYPETRVYTDVRIAACALFDSVWSSFDVGVWIPPLVNQYPATKVTKAFHAMSLNEDRYYFSLMRWNKKTLDNNNFKERWFLGHHSDVGTGNVSFIWMVDQIRHLVPQLNESKVKDFISRGVLHHGKLRLHIPWLSNHFINHYWRLNPYLKQVLFFYYPRKPREGDVLHFSVRKLLDRAESNCFIDSGSELSIPDNLREDAPSTFEKGMWEREALYGVDLE